MEKLTILCVTVSAMGHINPAIAVATALKNRGHRVVFAVERSWKGKLEKWGFEEEIYDERDEGNEEVDTAKQWAEMLNEKAEQFKLLPMERTAPSMIEPFLNVNKYSHSRVEEIVKTVKPNVIIEDLLVFMPALLTANAPIVKLYSMNPLFGLISDKLPPHGSGLPLDDNTDWEKFRKISAGTRVDGVKKMNEWFQSINVNSPVLCVERRHTSTNLNIYMYPKAAVEDYVQRCQFGPEWIGIEHCIREPSGDFELPKEFNERPGKLILLSLGSGGSSIIELMKRLVAILSKSKHKFIVVKGHFHDKYELPENMWGEAFVPQLDILPLIDLIITHGGNNTFVESLYFGKPMIVLPLYGDQFDNAQRAVEMKIGHRFNPFTVSEEELNDAIDSLINDEKVTEKLNRISKEMKESKSIDAVVDRIELVAKNPKFPTIV